MRYLQRKPSDFARDLSPRPTYGFILLFTPYHPGNISSFRCLKPAAGSCTSETPQMDIAKLLAVPASYDAHDILSLQEENDRLRRVLAATARSFNVTKKELDIAKEELGHNKSPIRFLEFPREVRDIIYLYALGSSHFSTEPRPIAWLAFEFRQMKPDTPDLCLANKQVYQESVEVLYSRNAFRFELPFHLLEFEEQIGSSNRDLIRRIEIATTDHLPRNHLMLDPHLIAPCDYQPIPTHWAKALSASKLKHITEMVVVNYPSQKWLSRVEIIDDFLKIAVEGVFARNEDPSLVPRLTLEGFGESERRKFSHHWKIVIIGPLSGPEIVAHSATFASATLSSDNTNFGLLHRQDELSD